VQADILKILIDILRTEMVLEAEQVVIYNQQWVVKNDKRLYIALHILGSKPYANNRRYRPGFVQGESGDPTAVLNQEQSLNVQEMISLHCASFGAAARIRRNEPMFAFNCTYAEQQQEKYGFQIGRIPTSFVDASEALGTEILNRYVTTFNVLYAQGVTKPVEYYQKFPVGQTVLQP
jgi:hypothetical protein